MKFQWTTIQVTNLDNSLKFYKDLLGMKISRVIEGGNHQIVMLGEDDDAKIELIPISTASKENLGNGVSIGIAFKQLDDLVEKIKSKNKVKSVDKDSSGSKKSKKAINKNCNSGVFRNNYKNYQYDYEEDFYEPY